MDLLGISENREFWVSGILRTPELSNYQADSLQIKFINWIALAYRCATSWSFAHQTHTGVPTGVISALKTVFTERGNP